MDAINLITFAISVTALILAIIALIKVIKEK